MKITITGATGLIGKALSVSLQKSFHEVRILARNPKRVDFVPLHQVHDWSLGSSFPLESIREVDAVVHLMGEPVAEGRWTKDRKIQILKSRVESTRMLIAAIKDLKPELRPKTLICASAIGIYGNRGDELLSESSAKGSGFLADVTDEWEKAAHEVEAFGVRCICIRTGIVLSKDGGALHQMKPVILGEGKNWMSWIHLDDVVRFIEYALQQEEIRGPYNLVSPHPVTNREFTQSFAKAIHFGVVVSAPAFALRLALGEMAEVVLGSQKVEPQRALDAGFQFAHSQLDPALQAIYRDQTYLDSYLHSVQFVPAPLEKVFSFFSAAENLEQITPPWLQFKVMAQSTTPLQNDTRIDYRLKVHGVPIEWQSRMSDWETNVKFTDDQLRGPYSKWHHEHRFDSVPNGTLVSDQVTYRVPGGSLGKASLGGWIGHDVRKIFSFRKKKIQSIFTVDQNL